MFGKYIFRTDFDPRSGQHPDESHMDEYELDSYNVTADIIDRNYWDQFCVEQQEKDAKMIADMSPFAPDPDLDDPFGSS